MNNIHRSELFAAAALEGLLASGKQPGSPGLIKDAIKLSQKLDNQFANVDQTIHGLKNINAVDQEHTEPAA
jgi:hypothetical protein